MPDYVAVPWEQLLRELNLREEDFRRLTPPGPKFYRRTLDEPYFRRANPDDHKENA